MTGLFGDRNTFHDGYEFLTNALRPEVGRLPGIGVDLDRGVIGGKTVGDDFVPGRIQGQEPLPGGVQDETSLGRETERGRSVVVSVSGQRRGRDNRRSGERQ